MTKKTITVIFSVLMLGLIFTLTTSFLLERFFMEKKHVYSFTFTYTDETNTRTTVSTYMGYKYNFISIPQIEDAKKYAGVSDKAVLLSCCYLGYMTKNEVKTGNREPHFLTRCVRSVSGGL